MVTVGHDRADETLARRYHSASVTGVAALTTRHRTHRDPAAGNSAGSLLVVVSQWWIRGPAAPRISRFRPSARLARQRPGPGAVERATPPSLSRVPPGQERNPGTSSGPNHSPGPPEHVVLKGPHNGPNVSEAARGRRVGRAGGLAGGDRAQRGPDHPGGCALRHRVRSRCGAPTLDGVGRPGERSVGGREGRGAGGVDSCGGRGTSPTYPCLMCPRHHLASAVSQY